jgi:hypothetical protein
VQTANPTTPPLGRQRSRRRWWRSLVLVVAAVVLAGIALLRFGPAQRDEPPPSAAELRRHWQAGLRWMQANRAQLLADGNPMLWRMVRDAAAVSREPMLDEMLRAWRQNHFPREPFDAWLLLVDPSARPANPRPAGFAALPAYMKLFAYGTTCDPAIGAVEVVQKQTQAGWCSAWAPRRVARQSKCVTHQLVGVMLMQQRQCGDPAAVAALVRQLQDRIVDELSLDPVMRDAYLQRVLMLYWTDAPQRVKPVWLNRVLRAQRPDGGWDYTSSFEDAAGDIRNDFHATAQGLLIVALALREAESTRR